MKLTPIQLRIVGYLKETRSPATFFDLMVLASTASVNTAIAALLAAGVVEPVEVGEGVGVRLVKKAEPEIGT